MRLQLHRACCSSFFLLCAGWSGVRRRRESASNAHRTTLRVESSPGWWSMFGLLTVSRSTPRPFQVGTIVITTPTARRLRRLLRFVCIAPTPPRRSTTSPTGDRLPTEWVGVCLRATRNLRLSVGHELRLPILRRPFCLTVRRTLEHSNHGAFLRALRLTGALGLPDQPLWVGTTSIVNIESLRALFP